VNARIGSLALTFQQRTGDITLLMRHLLSSITPETLYKYNACWVKFKLWLYPETLAVVDDMVVCLYVSHLIGLAVDHSTGHQAIDNAMSAIAFYFGLMGRVSPTHSLLCTRLRLTAKRVLSASKSTCEAITAAELHAVLVFHLTAACSLRIRMHLTVFLLMFVGLLRYDDAACILVHADLLQFISVSRADSRDDGIVLFLHSSKTDQTGDGAWVAIGATRGRFCPVRLLRELLQLGGYVRDHPSEDVGPLLRGVKLRYRPHKHHILQQLTSPFSQPIPALSYASFLVSIQHLVAEAGVSKHVGLHAGRSGGASTAASVGINPQSVCGLGRWKMGNTFADTYVNMIDGNARKYFDITRRLWPFA
jgi:hypothetical protein